MVVTTHEESSLEKIKDDKAQTCTERLDPSRASTEPKNYQGGRKSI